MIDAVLAGVFCAVVVWAGLPVRADTRCRNLMDAAPRKADSLDAGPTSAQLAAMLDLTGAALDAGLPPASALSLVMSARPGASEPFRRMAAVLELGGDGTDSWKVLGADPMLGPLAHAMARAERSGAPVAASVRVLADECRRDERSRRLERARRVGVRTAVPLGVCFLPAFLLVAVVPTVIGLVRAAL